MYIYIDTACIFLHSIYNILFHFSPFFSLHSFVLSLLFLLFTYSSLNDLNPDEERKCAGFASASQVPSIAWQTECMQYIFFFCMNGRMNGISDVSGQIAF